MVRDKYEGVEKGIILIDGSPTQYQDAGMSNVEFGSPKVVVVGNLTLDDTILADGTVRLAVPGGNALYSIVSARLWSESVGVVARVGQGYPEEIYSELQTAGVSLEGWRSVERETLREWVLYEDLETRRYLSRNPAVGSLQLTNPIEFDQYLRIVGQHQLDLSPDSSDIPRNYSAAEIFHIAPMAPERQLQLLRYLRSSTKAKILLDPHYDLMADRDEAILEQALAHSDYFLPSEEDLAAHFDRFSEDTLSRLAERGPEVVGVKRGGGGSLIYSRRTDDLYRLPAFPSESVDSTGAGDAFCAGFAAAIAMEEELPDAAACGSSSASLVIQDFGGLHMLSADQQVAMERKAWILERTV